MIHTSMHEWCDKEEIKGSWCWVTHSSKSSLSLPLISHIDFTQLADQAASEIVITLPSPWEYLETFQLVYDHLKCWTTQSYMCSWNDCIGHTREVFEDHLDCSLLLQKKKEEKKESSVDVWTCYFINWSNFNKFWGQKIVWTCSIIFWVLLWYSFSSLTYHAITKVLTIHQELFFTLSQCPESFWAYRVGQEPSDSKSSRLHVDIIFRFCVIHLRYILL